MPVFAPGFFKVIVGGGIGSRANRWDSNLLLLLFQPLFLLLYL